ncbi:hypothetical protein [Aliihoeflea sp. PC F10.4]
MSLLGFHTFAVTRGDGLHPALRELLESRQAIETDTRVIDLASRTGSMTQAGPNPVPRDDEFRPGNVVGFANNRKQIALCAQSTKSMKEKA